MGLAARNDRRDWISKFRGRRLVALAPASRLGDGFWEELLDVLRQIGVRADVGVVEDVHGGGHASQCRRRLSATINETLVQQTYELVRFSSRL